MAKAPRRKTLAQFEQLAREAITDATENISCRDVKEFEAGVERMVQVIRERSTKIVQVRRRARTDLTPAERMQQCKCCGRIMDTPPCPHGVDARCKCQLCPHGICYLGCSCKECDDEIFKLRTRA